MNYLHPSLMLKLKLQSSLSHYKKLQSHIISSQSTYTMVVICLYSTSQHCSTTSLVTSLNHVLSNMAWLSLYLNPQTRIPPHKSLQLSRHHSPIVRKLFEKVILQCLYDHTNIDSCISPLQGGFRPGVSCLHTGMIFHEHLLFTVLKRGTGNQK